MSKPKFEERVTVNFTAPDALTVSPWRSRHPMRCSHLSDLALATSGAPYARQHGRLVEARQFWHPAHFASAPTPAPDRQTRTKTKPFWEDFSAGVRRGRWRTQTKTLRF